MIQISAAHLKSVSLKSKNISNKKIYTQPNWWDIDCQTIKSQKYNCLEQFRRCRTDENLNLYINKKKRFKHMCMKKQKLFK